MSGLASGSSLRLASVGPPPGSGAQLPGGSVAPAIAVAEKAIAESKSEAKASKPKRKKGEKNNGEPRKTNAWNVYFKEMCKTPAIVAMDNGLRMAAVAKLWHAQKGAAAAPATGYT